MNYSLRIVSDPNIMLGKPIIKGTRITVESILKRLAEGISIQEILKAYPNLTKDDILAAIEYAADVISQEAVIT
ncbi:MAG: DUF433 domain-containing protein [Bacteroidota bacterium]